MQDENTLLLRLDCFKEVLEVEDDEFELLRVLLSDKKPDKVKTLVERLRFSKRSIGCHGRDRVHHRNHHRFKTKNIIGVIFCRQVHLVGERAVDVMVFDDL